MKILVCHEIWGFADNVVKSYMGTATCLLIPMVDRQTALAREGNRHAEIFVSHLLKNYAMKLRKSDSIHIKQQ